MTKIQKNIKLHVKKAAAFKKNEGQSLKEEILSKLPQQVKDIDPSFPSEMYLKYVLENRPPEVTPAIKFKEYKYTMHVASDLFEKAGTLKRIHTLNTARFSAFIRHRLDNQVRGYHVEVMCGSKVIASVSHGLSRNTADGINYWNAHTRIHLASTSKFITAVALAKVLKEKNISYHDYIYKYLPAYWSISEDNKKVTFHQLLTHTSGFRWNGSSQYYDDLRNIMMSANKHIGTPNYCNANFGIIRILLPIVTGVVNRNLLVHIEQLALPYPTLELLKTQRHQIWNGVTINLFKDYVLQYIFQPAGVVNCITDPDLSKTADYPADQIYNTAFGYRGPDDELHGMNSGDLAGLLGGVGFRLTANEYVKILRKIMVGSTILKKSEREELLNGHYGIGSVETVCGTGFRHNGGWSGGDGAEESSMNIFPGHIYIVGLCSSEPKGVPGGLEGSILDAFNDAMTSG